MANEVNPKLSTDLYYSPLETINLFLKSVNLSFFWGKHFWWTWTGHSLEWDAFQPNREHFTIAVHTDTLLSEDARTGVIVSKLLRPSSNSSLGSLWCNTAAPHTFIPVELVTQFPWSTATLAKPLLLSWSWFFIWKQEIEPDGPSHHDMIPRQLPRPRQVPHIQQVEQAWIWVQNTWLVLLLLLLLSRFSRVRLCATP